MVWHFQSVAKSLICAAALCAGIAVAAQPPGVTEAAQQQARTLVQGLSSANWAERNNASQELLRLGRASVEPLEYAVKSDDPEVRMRALELLIALRGRGFLGIGLQQSDDHADAFGMYIADPEPDENKNERPGVVPRPVVSANQIVNSQQPLYDGMRATKPFPAAAAGMQVGDKVLAINDRPIYGVKDLMREVITVGPARLAILLVERDGKRIRVPVTLTRNPLTTRTIGIGAGYQIEREANPPVDLERELDGGNPQQHSSAALPANQPAIQQQVQILPGGQIQIQPGAQIRIIRR
ncbi:MAG TPA: PDZ domain-containing protein [Planctomycetota bacterium]|jgi:membrane-associated protease RseP (regulator of RpoE activity)